MRKLHFTLLFTALIALCSSQLTYSALPITKQSISRYAQIGNHQSKQSQAEPLYSEEEIIGMAYGIRAYDDIIGADQKLVSFYLNDPGTIKVVKDLSDYYIRAASFANGKYYMINSADGLATYDLLELDFETMEIRTIASYDISDYEAALIFLDMAYDQKSETMYGIAYDLETGETTDSDDVIEVDMALVKIDLLTGEMTAVGHQSYCSLITIAVDRRGDMWGLDSNGELWDINKSTGRPTDTYGYATDLPTSLQSMTFNSNDNRLYWSGFSVKTDQSGTQAGYGFLSRFTFKEDIIEYQHIGQLADNAEIIGLYIDPEPLAETAPAAADNINVTAGENGQNSAIIEFTMPTTLINGESASENMTAHLYRNENEIATLSEKSVGEKIVFTDSDAPTGMTRYKIVCENSSGEGKAGYSRELWLGPDFPNAVDNLSAKKSIDKDEVIITWSQPTSGLNEGWYDKESLTYDLIRYPDNKLLLDNSTATTYTDTDFTQLQGYSYQVISSNILGEGGTKTSNTVVVGPALNIPYSCDFSTDETTNTWTVIDADNDTQTWFASSYSSTGQSFMKYAPDMKYNPEITASDWLISPPLNLKKGEHYLISYDLFLLGDLFPFDYNLVVGKNATVEDMTNIIDSKEKLVINMSFEPQNAILTVEEDGVYYIGFEARNAVLAQITNFNVGTLSDYDLSAIKVTAKSVGNVGTESEFNVTIKNNGYSTIDTFDVELQDFQNNTLASTTIDKANLQSLQEMTITLKWTPDDAGEISVLAKVSLNDDKNSDNDYSQSTSLEILESGDWAHINPGIALMNYTPFVPTYKYSTVQTIYTADEIGFASGKIKGLMYYTYIFNNYDVENFMARIYLANTDINEFTGSNALKETNMTLVYEGNINVDNYATDIYIPLDVEFDYTGQNLCIMTEQEGQGANQSLMFYGYRTEEGEPERMWYYFSDDAPYSNLQTPEYEIANVSLFMTNTTDVKTVNTDRNAIEVRGGKGEIIIKGNYKDLKIFDIAGYEYHSNLLPAGIYIVCIDGQTFKVAVR